MRPKGVAIIGAGLQARRRMPVINTNKFPIRWVVDIVEERAKALAMPHKAQFGTDWQKAFVDPDVAIVVVLTYPESHARISIAAMEAGKDVFCEKPLARTIREARRMISVAQKTRCILKCGFNHRHHPALQKAYTLYKEGLIGNAIFGRGRYGITGRKGIEKEWRSDPAIVGGGQLMEQGIHLVDLFRWFVGDIVKVTGFVGTNYWPIPVEDNGFALLQTKRGVAISIHSSLTQWINLFEFELYGEKGSLSVCGLGESYGIERLVIALRDPNGPFSYQTIEYRGGDVSWKNEWDEFIDAVGKRRQVLGSGLDGLRAMEIVDGVYTASRTNRTVFLS